MRAGAHPFTVPNARRCTPIGLRSETHTRAQLESQANPNAGLVHFGSGGRSPLAVGDDDQWRGVQQPPFGRFPFVAALLRLCAFFFPALRGNQLAVLPEVNMRTLYPFRKRKVPISFDPLDPALDAVTAALLPLRGPDVVQHSTGDDIARCVVQ